VSLTWELREPSQSQQTILFGESNAAVRKAIHRTLERENYRVLEATTGRQALELCREHPGPIHLLLSEISLPGAHGPELARLVTAMRPLTRIVFLSSEPEERNREAGVCPGCWLLVRKPFRPVELAAVVRAVLSDDPTTSRGALLQAGLVE